MSAPMSGLPADTDPDHVPEAMVANLRSAARGDPDAWRHPDLLDVQLEVEPARKPPVNMGEAAHQFMLDAGMIPTQDAIEQLLEVFVPCLRIMCDQKGHPWPKDGALWRKSGIGPVLIFARAKFSRFWYRTWIKGIRHDDSGYDCINFLGMSLRANPEDMWGDYGEPFHAGQEADDANS